MYKFLSEIRKREAEEAKLNNAADHNENNSTDEQLSEELGGLSVSEDESDIDSVSERSVNNITEKDIHTGDSSSGSGT